jgi:hypothetical protein
VIELDPKYCDVAVRRWQDYTGDFARHANSGRAFNDLVGGAEVAARPVATETLEASNGIAVV